MSLNIVVLWPESEMSGEIHNHAICLTFEACIAVRKAEISVSIRVSASRIFISCTPPSSLNLPYNLYQYRLLEPIHLLTLLQI
jgi:hypothetical protein